jgi:hypothetical protein
VESARVYIMTVIQINNMLVLLRLSMYTLTLLSCVDFPGEFLPPQLQSILGEVGGLMFSTLQFMFSSTKDK